MGYMGVYTIQLNKERSVAAVRYLLQSRVQVHRLLEEKVNGGLPMG